MINQSHNPKLTNFLQSHQLHLRDFQSALTTHNRFTALMTKINIMNPHIYNSQPNSKQLQRDDIRDDQTQEGVLRGLFKMFEGILESGDSNLRTNQRKKCFKNQNQQKRTSKTSGSSSVHLTRFASLLNFNAEGDNIGDCQSKEIFKQSSFKRKNGWEKEQTLQYESIEEKQRFRENIRLCEKENQKKYFLLKNFSLSQIADRLPLTRQMKKKFRQEEETLKNNFLQKQKRLNKEEQANKKLRKKVKHLQHEAEKQFGLFFSLKGSNHTTNKNQQMKIHYLNQRKKRFRKKLGVQHEHLKNFKESKKLSMHHLNQNIDCIEFATAENQKDRRSSMEEKIFEEDQKVIREALGFKNLTEMEEEDKKKKVKVEKNNGWIPICEINKLKRKMNSYPLSRKKNVTKSMYIRL